MNVAVRLISHVGKLPPGIGADGKGSLPFADGTTLLAVLKTLNLRTDEPLMALVNGEAIAPGDRATTALKDGDEVTVFPPIEGG